MLSNKRLTIVDYGIGNIGSLINMFDLLGIDVSVSDTAAGIRCARSVILPGVGAFDTAMEELKARGLIDALNEAALHRKIPVLGICLGMQLLGKSSEEGLERGLAWIDATAKRLTPPAGSGLKVPHVGWADIRVKADTPLFPGTFEEERFYFVHSYALECANPSIVAATIFFGDDVCCAIAQGNIFGVQFHPEKSHRFGMRLLADYARHA